MSASALLSPLAEIDNPDFWRKLAPEFNVCGADYAAAINGVAPSEALRASGRQTLRTEGYLHLSGVLPQARATAMADLIERLHARDLPPVFLMMFDEPWLAFRQLHPVLSFLFDGEYAVLPDFWAWRLDAKREEGGWRPHRDKGFRALYDDKTAKSLTVWMALTPATPLNGCMYMVPANRDPTYGTPDDKNWQFEHANVRALPGERGDCFIWNQAVLHWGGRSNPRAAQNRMSMALEFQRKDVAPFNTPLFDIDSYIDFDVRLLLICKQILQYQHMYALPPWLQSFAVQRLTPR